MESLSQPAQPRIVVFSRGRATDPHELGKAMSPAQVIAAPSAYEAAAEVLAAPTAALVVDLSLLEPRHTRLITIARRAGAEVLAVGSGGVGIDAEALSGARLVAKGQLVAELKRLMQSAGESIPSRPATGEDEPKAGSPDAESAVKQAPASIRPVPQKAELLKQPTDPAGLLTPEELAALLEKMP